MSKLKYSTVQSAILAVCGVATGSSRETPPVALHVQATYLPGITHVAVLAVAATES